MFAGAVPIINNKYRLGTGPTVLQSVRCTGFEERLIECISSDFDGSCSNHVGVECLEGESSRAAQTGLQRWNVSSICWPS